MPRSGPAHPPTNTTTVAVSSTDLTSDVVLALALAAGRPTGEAVDVLRDRLTSYINAFADAADAYAHHLTDPRERHLAVNTVEHARALASDQGPFKDPAAHLRLLARSAESAARYASAAHRTAGPHSGLPAPRGV